MSRLEVKALRPEPRPVVFEAMAKDMSRTRTHFLSSRTRSWTPSLILTDTVPNNI